MNAQKSELLFEPVISHLSVVWSIKKLSGGGIQTQQFLHHYLALFPTKNTYFFFADTPLVYKPKNESLFGNRAFHHIYTSKLHIDCMNASCQVVFVKK